MGSFKRAQPPPKCKVTFLVTPLALRVCFNGIFSQVARERILVFLECFQLWLQILNLTSPQFLIFSKSCQHLRACRIHRNPLNFKDLQLLHPPSVGPAPCTVRISSSRASPPWIQILNLGMKVLMTFSPEVSVHLLRRRT